MGFHEAVLVIGSLVRHRSHPSEFPIILVGRKTLAGLILRDAMSSILLAIDRQFAPVACPRFRGTNANSRSCHAQLPSWNPQFKVLVLRHVETW